MGGGEGPGLAAACSCSQSWRALKKCVGREERAPTERIVHISQVHHPQHARYANNYSRTTKYTLITYFPKSLFEQVWVGLRGVKIVRSAHSNTLLS